MPPTLLAALVLSGQPTLSVDPFCNLDSRQLRVHVAINQKWHDKDGDQSDGDKLWSIKCDVNTKRCWGARIDLAPASGGTRLGLQDIIHLDDDATLVSVAGRVAIVTWGYHQFVVDLEAGTVTQSSGPPGGGGNPRRGVGNCSPPPRR
jgi:hypothetical protein